MNGQVIAEGTEALQAGRDKGASWGFRGLEFRGLGFRSTPSILNLAPLEIRL